ncbi:molybdopterin-guanine dinucleotide biosynthesis protein MobB [Robertmurraya siralis]|uniref:Molybdopterin-guanine dinucleotide biosynthesis protein MobB n=1 Tax=Robertmurraya siralis TaxID=77777 RepID=A0A919WJP8_9BACI|nr:molybdopterin-guanine dinucleotide biosynthesis protein B [Robertmurraya siralis]GIN62937.1 molybdopterin-guanine dinucleotide biosynthesis protein MobB [Robertmurraya siralis]
MVDATIFQIVGYQNSGKTTFIKRMLSQLQQSNLSIVTLKHHGHGGKPDFQEEKDSHQHLKAGAVASLVEGDGHLLLHAEKSHWSLEEKLHLLSYFRPDLILIEGHKREPYPKAVLIRTQADVEILLKLDNIRVIFYWDEKLLEASKNMTDIKGFSINDPAGYEWLANYLQFKK